MPVAKSTLDALPRPGTWRRDAVRCLLSAACCLLFFFPLRAARGLYQLCEVKPGVFAWIANDVRDFQGDPRFSRAGTSGFVITPDGVVVVDTTNSPFHAREMLYEIRQRTDLPVRYVINTSSDGDRMLGNEVFSDQQATILSTAGARAEMEQYQRELPARLEADFQLPARMRGIHPTPPTQTFEREMTLRLGGQEIVLRSELDQEPSSTEAVVYLPAAKVLFMGSLFENGFVPRVGNRDVRRWVNILRQVESWDVDTYIPRRGLPGSKQDITSFRRFFEWLTQEVANRIQEGKTLDAIKADLLSLDAFPRGGRDSAPAVVEAVYEQLVNVSQAQPAPDSKHQD